MRDPYPEDATSRIAPRPSLRVWSLELVVVDGPAARRDRLDHDRARRASARPRATT